MWSVKILKPWTKGRKMAAKRWVFVVMGEMKSHFFVTGQFGMKIGKNFSQCALLKLRVVWMCLRVTCLAQGLRFYSARNARIASAELATAIPSVRLSVCPSVRPSHAGIVSKRRHIARCSLHRWIAKCV